VTRSPLVLAVALALLLIPLPAPLVAADRPSVTWHPAKPRPGDVAWVLVQGVPDGVAIEGSLGVRSLLFFPYAGGQAAVVGIDLETKSGPQAWQLAILESGREPRRLSGTLTLARRDFAVQHLKLPSNMVDLDPETEKRAVAEGERLRTLYRTITPERLWRGRWTRPVAGHEPGTGFGSRRVINGQPRAPHTGIDFAAPKGTPVVAVNSGRVALLGDYFFPGRLVALDHGLGLYTLYFHLDTVAVTDGERVERGQTIGTVGSTGRATGPHLHFGAQAGAARVDPAALLGLDVND
jgi:murein DD-endopeptidase MepM/ murein hydrolase activator NlpD